MSEKKVILILGKRGSGKSYLANKMIQDSSRLFVYDTLSEYKEGVIFGTESRDQLIEFWTKNHKNNFRIIYRPINPEHEIDLICRLLFVLGDVTFLVEEVDVYCSAYKISEHFAGIIQRGRHKHITLIGVTQRPYGIHRLLTSQAKEAYIFNTNEPRDRDYLRTWIGQAIEPVIDKLEKYHYAKWIDGQDQIETGKA